MAKKEIEHIKSKKNLLDKVVEHLEKAVEEIQGKLDQFDVKEESWQLKEMTDILNKCTESLRDAKSLRQDYEWQIQEASESSR